METKAIIKGWNHFRKHARKDFKALIQTHITQMEKLFNQAYHFRLGTCWKDVVRTDITGITPELKMPYPVILLSTDPVDMETEDPYACLMVSKQISKEIFNLEYEKKEYFFDYLCMPLLCLSDLSAIFPTGFLTGIPNISDLDTMPADDVPAHILSPDLVAFHAEQKISLKDYSAVGAVLARYFLQLIHCKNITTREVREKKSCHLLKKKNNISLKEHDIILTLPGKGIMYRDTYLKEVPFRDVGKLGMTGQRRGHFKTYTEDAPLFGKLTGTWWWSPIFGTKHRNYSIQSLSDKE